jgi:putative oxygen-independent coproporphyrinogen III oxidase
VASGAYVHIPFCQSRCSYCHFTTRPWQALVAERYLQAVIREIERFTPAAGPTPQLTTIYFGGGTPSLVPESHIQGILRALRIRFGIDPDAEISLEANPGTLTTARIQVYRESGVSRVSMGAQSFDDSSLRFLGRTHTSGEVLSSVALLRAEGIENINLDLMLGLPGQTSEAWIRDLDQLCDLAVPHVSIYMLDLDVHTPLQHAVSKGLYRVPEDDLVSDLYVESIDRLEVAGYRQYEISNFARPGFECRHNLRYWRQEPVLGFGVSSHSHDGRSRYANFTNLSAYLDAMEQGASVVEWHTPLSAERQLEEAMFLGLRLIEGVDWQRLASRFGTGPVETAKGKVRSLVEAGLLEERGSALWLTRRGMLLSNEVFQRFV